MLIQSNNEDVREKRREYNRRYIQKHKTEERICIICWKPFKVVNYSINPSSKNRKKTCSKQCRKTHISQVSKDWAKANPERVITRAKEIIQDRKFSVLAIYSEGQPRCACCGETEISFLTMDHINNNGAEHRKKIFKSKTRGGYSFYVWIIKNNFPEDLQVLCMNCQFGKKFNEGICPHEFKQLS
jgi:hypothetical protein